MRFFVFKLKQLLFIILGVIVVILLILLFLYTRNLKASKMVMGGSFKIQEFIDDEKRASPSGTVDFEKYFRPSKLPILNNRILGSDFFQNYYEMSPSDIKIPDKLLKTPEDTLINYYSILKDASNPVENKHAGCGTIGQAGRPYPIAYNFLSNTYKEKLSFNEYFKSFENILHINLIKLKKVPFFNAPQNTLRYFVEIETIQGSEGDAANFAYYYGFIDVTKEGNQFKISNMKFTGENYLCAPFHGWDYMAEYVVDIKYGNWCHLVKKRYPTKTEGYIKKIYFKGTDGNDYLIEFYTLTNDTDIEIAQYKKDPSNQFKLIKLDPDKCLDKNKPKR